MKKLIHLIACCLVLIALANEGFAQRTAEDYFKTSQSRFMSRDLDGAIAALDKAIELKPDFANAYFQRSRLRMLKGDIDRALADVDKALFIDSELAPAYAERANIRMMKNDMKGALSDLDNAIVRGYRSDEVYSMRANLKLMSRDIEGAASDFNTAISMNPDRIGNYLGRAATRRMSGDEAGAIADYTAVIDSFEADERDRRAGGKPGREAPVFDIVSPVIKGTERSKPGEPQVKTRIDAVVMDSPSKMTAALMEYLPNVAGAYISRGEVYSKRNDSDAAMADFEKSIAVYPGHFLAYERRGKEWRKRGDLPAALADFNKAIEMQRLPQSYVERGVTLILMGKDEEAEKDFERCLALAPEMKTWVENRRAAAKKERQEKLP